MAYDVRNEFVVHRNDFTIVVNREYDGARQLVWDCHTKAEYLDQWFAPKPLTTQTKHMDFRAGGYWHYAMVTPDGQKFWNRLDYHTINPIDGYTAKDGFCDESGTVNPDMPQADWDVAFADSGARTLVTTVVRYGSAEKLQAVIDMGMEAGIASTMERLDELLIAMKNG